MLFRSQYIQTPYGMVKNDAAYKKYLAQKGVSKNVDLGISSLEPQAAVSQDDYETESAWGYPNSSRSSFYAKRDVLIICDRININ